MSLTAKLYKPLIILCACAALGLGGWLGLKHQPSATMHPAITSLFVSKLITVTGDPFPITMYQDKPMLINIWAPWCAPCVEELPELSALSTSDAAAGVQFIGLGVDTPEHISDFSVRHPVNFPLVVAGNAGVNLAKALGNSAGALPFTALVNAKGEVVAQKTGRIHAEEIKLWLQKLDKINTIQAK